MDIEQYRKTAQEKARTDDLLRLIPARGTHVLDIGARDGYFSRLLTERFDTVTALDLTQPSFSFARVTTLAGSVLELPFPDRHFDCVFCAEVLEHVPGVERACAEILRVTSNTAVIGVPFNQDTRVGETRCAHCGKHNPPWGHINTFTEARLRELFRGGRIRETSFVGSTRERTNSLSAWMMRLAGNPYGMYDQEEPCIFCGHTLVAPSSRTLLSRVLTAGAVRLTRMQQRFTAPAPIWIQLLIEKV